MLRPTRTVLFVFALSLSVRVASAKAEEDDDDNFRADVCACEDAVAHLASCCPDFHAGDVRCVYSRHRSNGCDVYTKYEEDPAIPLDQAECVLALDCGAVRERGICGRAQRLVPERSSSYYELGSSKGGTSSHNEESLCR